MKSTEGYKKLFSNTLLKAHLYNELQTCLLCIMNILIVHYNVPLVLYNHSYKQVNPKPNQNHDH